MKFKDDGDVEEKFRVIVVELLSHEAFKEFIDEWKVTKDRGIKTKKKMINRFMKLYPDIEKKLVVKRLEE